MSEETSLEKKKAKAQNLLEKFKSAVNQPRLYVYQFTFNYKIIHLISYNRTNEYLLLINSIIIFRKSIIFYFIFICSF